MLTNIQREAIRESIFNKWRLANLIDKTPPLDIAEVYDILLGEVVKHSQRLFNKELSRDMVILKIREAAAITTLTHSSKDITPGEKMKRVHAKILASFLDRRTRPSDREKSLRNYLSKAILNSPVTIASVISNSNDVIITVSEFDSSVKRPSTILRHAVEHSSEPLTLYHQVVLLRGDNRLALFSQVNLEDAVILEIKKGLERILFDSRVIDVVKSSDQQKRL